MAPPVSGYSVWYDASDTASITSSGGLVSQWNDKSATGANLTQATGSNQPTTGANTLNGLNVITFPNPSPNGKWMASTAVPNSSQPYTFFAVHQPGGTANGRVFDTELSSFGRFLLDDGANYGMYAGTQLNGSAVTAGLTVVRSCIFNSTSSTSYVNGTLDASGNAGTQPSGSGHAWLGSDSGGGTVGKYYGLIGELILYPSGLNATDRQSTESYLTSKWIPAAPADPTVHPPFQQTVWRM